MKTRIAILVLLFSCCTEIQPIDNIVGEHITLRDYNVTLNFDGLGLTEESFSNARTIADWSHILSDSVGLLEVVRQDSTVVFREEYKFKGMGDMNVTLPLGNYFASVQPTTIDYYGLLFSAVSPLFDARTGDVLVPVTTDQGLVLVDSDIVATDSIPRLISGDPPHHLFGLHLGFYYMYLREIDSDRMYIVEWYDGEGRRRETDLVGLNRETYYLISDTDDGTSIRFDLAGLFKDTVIIDD